MGFASKMLEGIALGIGIVLGFYIFASIGFLGIGNFVTLIADRIGDLFSSVGV